MADLDLQQERALFEAAYLAEFGDPDASDIANGVELAWLTGPGKMWLAGRRESVAAPIESSEVRELRGMITGGKHGALAWVRLQYPDQPTTNKAVAEAWIETGWDVVALDTGHSTNDSSLLDWIDATINTHGPVWFVPSGHLRFVQVRTSGKCWNGPTVPGIRAAIGAAMEAFSRDGE